MTIRKVKQELEAHLVSTKKKFFAPKLGKLERKEYADGSEKLRVKLRGIAVDDGRVLSLRADSQEFAQVTIFDRRGNLELQSTDGDDVPPLGKGQLIEVFDEDTVIANGVLKVD